MWDEKSVMQSVYEYIVQSGRSISTREIVSAVGASSASAITFALTRLVREGVIARLSRGEYRAVSQDEKRETVALDPLSGNEQLARIFESIRPVLSFEDLSLLYNVVLTTLRIAPELFKKAKIVKTQTIKEECP